MPRFIQVPVRLTLVVPAEYDPADIIRYTAHTVATLPTVVGIEGAVDTFVEVSPEDVLTSAVEAYANGDEVRIV